MIISRLFWDRPVPPVDVEKLIEEKLQTINEIQSQHFLRKLLTSCDWYTLLKIVPAEKLAIILDDKIVNGLFPRDLQTKYKYARDLLNLNFVNDIASHFGDIQPFALFHRVDSWRNILSNKICALSRLEVKDIVDVLFIARTYDFDWETITSEAKEKDIWVDPIEICRIIDRFPVDFFKTIKWIESVNADDLLDQIRTLHSDIFKGRENSLKL